ncbi:hypothetical protein HQO84_05410 [Rhodococcus fascians]|nr:hypothetical protein [Rhodococcus fascians]MBY3999576.1 hypothetical protein [Rhodococcus fascians]MBY4001212.1 hypothetical protein [Rhodococcus fascians]MBY4009523.1 hypothetical protein [Rhodococcus fascians]MBY4015366.1 hypothetical protein [Rhodococcus fascians]
MSGGSQYLTFDADGVPDAVVDVAEIRLAVDLLYATLLSMPTEDGEIIAATVADAVAKAGPAGGLVALNIVVKLLKCGVAPLAAELGRQGMTQTQVLALIQGEQ